MTHPIDSSVAYLKDQIGDCRPVIGIVLGSGLNDLVNSIAIKKQIPYENIPDFPRSTVPGHDGSFILGEYEGIRILAARGRFHYYEGYGMEKILTLMNVFNALNINDIIVTNAAGLMNPDHAPGDILVIRDGVDTTHLMASEDMPLAVLRDEEKKKIQNAARLSEVLVGTGVYVWTTGPSYETPAEIAYFRSLGGDLVGMSTLPEIVHARRLGMRVYPFSCATNWAAGISEVPLTHEEVTETADRVKHDLTRFILRLCKTIGDA